MKYVSIDTETTGLDVNNHQIIEIAVIIDDLLETKPLESLPVFHKYLQHPVYVGEAHALGLNQRIFDILSKPDSFRNKNIISYDTLNHHLEEFLYIENKFSKTDLINVAGKNSYKLDIPMILKLCPSIKFHHRALDPSILYFNPAIDQDLPSTDKCLKRANIKDEVDHTAVGDAFRIIKLLRHYYRNVC